MEARTLLAPAGRRPFPPCPQEHQLRTRRHVPVSRRCGGRSRSAAPARLGKPRRSWAGDRSARRSRASARHFSHLSQPRPLLQPERRPEGSGVWCGQRGPEGGQQRTRPAQGSPDVPVSTWAQPATHPGSSLRLPLPASRRTDAFVPSPAARSPPSADARTCGQEQGPLKGVLSKSPTLKPPGAVQPLHSRPTIWKRVISTCPSADPLRLQVCSLDPSSTTRLA